MKRYSLPLVAFVGLAILARLTTTADEDTAQRVAAEASTLYGNVDIREVALAFRQGGRVATVELEEGDFAEAGTLVATLDGEPFREAVAVAEARVELARIHLQRLERGTRPQEIERARAAVREAEAALVAAERELERKLGLASSGASSEREVEQAQERRDASRARLEGAREALDLAIEGPRREDVEAGSAELRLAEAQLEQARTALEDTRLVAPSEGAVLVRAQEPGALVGVGAPIAVLSLRQPVIVRAYVPEPLLGAASPGTSAVITTDSSERSYRGRVGFVSPRAEFTPKTVETPELRTDLVYRLRIVVEDADERLLQGMPVTVRLEPATAGRAG